MTQFLIMLQRFRSQKPAKIKAVINFQYISPFFFLPPRTFKTCEIHIPISHLVQMKFLEHTL